MVARFVRDEEVAGSNPVAPTIPLANPHGLRLAACRGSAGPMRILLHCRALPWMLLLPLWVACEQAGSPANHEVPVTLERIGLQEGAGPVLILEEQRGSRWIPIWIGRSEAESIARVLEGHSARRPNTHDLARDLLDVLGASVERCVVTELRADIYYARLVVRVQGELLEIDSRPSDAIAIALRAKAPLFVHASLLAEEKKPAPSSSEREI